MAFVLQQECPCCRAMLWHCEDCWNKYHNGLRDKDWIPPKYTGQPLIPREIIDEINRKFGEAQEAQEFGDEFLRWKAIKAFNKKKAKAEIRSQKRRAKV